MPRRSGQDADGHDLDGLLGLHASKGRWYREYRYGRSDLQRTFAAVNAVSWSLANAGGDAVRVVSETLPVVAQLLDARYVLLVTDHPGLGRGERVEVALPHGAARALSPEESGLLRPVLDHLWGLLDGGLLPGDLLGGVMQRVVDLRGSLLVVPMPRGGERCGCVAVLVDDEVHVDGTDLAILGSVTNQLAGAIESAHRLAEAAEQAAAVQRRTEMLRETRNELVAAREREVLAEERQRIGRELHDSVAQHVLSVGMQVEWCRTASTEPEVVEQLGEAKQLARTTVECIRQAIFELGGADELGPGLVAALRRTGRQHSAHGLRIAVRVVGEQQRLPTAVERALFKAAKEAVFNVVIHAEATRAAITLAFAPGVVRLLVSDDGGGRASQLRACLEEAQLSSSSGYHRGLANIDERVRLVRGTLRIRDGRTAGSRRGVRLEIVVPLGQEQQ